MALVRLAVTVSFTLDPGDPGLEVSTIALFVIPVLVAALDYGLAGGVATVGWVTLLCVPRVAEAAGQSKHGAVWVEVVQVAVLATVAVLVGHRVSAETADRDRADTALEARLHAELLYQELFESNRSPILIVDADGRVVQANQAADQVFGTLPMPSRLVDLVGPEAAALVLTELLASDTGPEAVTDPATSTGQEPPGDAPGDAPRTKDAGERVRPIPYEVEGQTVLYRPTATRVGTSAADRRLQVVFEDVTAETRRHDLMEAYAGQVVLGQEEERRHIAQELHDGPLQTLIHLCRQIDTLDTVDPVDGRAPADHPPSSPSLGSLRTTVEETVAELRSIARGLRPSVLDDLGLVASINQVLTEAMVRQGFDGRFDVDGTVRRLPPDVELALFRIAQEAITNVGRHAGADHVTVELGFAPDVVRLAVEDDGSGFDQDRHRREDDGQSLGLPGMGERARLVGGRLEVRSQPGRGTAVVARVPVAPPDGTVCG